MRDGARTLGLSVASGKRIARRLSEPALIVWLALQLACGSPDDEFTTTLKTVSSWTATAHLVADAWRNGSVPTLYATRTLQTARETLQEEQEKVGKPELQQLGEARARLLTRLQNLGQVIGEMQATIERNDHQALAELLDRLTAEESALEAINHRIQR